MRPYHLYRRRSVVNTDFYRATPTEAILVEPSIYPNVVALLDGRAVGTLIDE